MRIRSRHSQAPCRARGGFSLVEMLLVVVLTMTFAAAAVVSLAPLWKSAPLDEGVGRFEGLLRFARAEAAHQGRRVRLHVTPQPPAAGGKVCDAPLVQIEWEPEPLSQPGVFVENQSTAALAQSLRELVRVESIRHIEPELESYSADNVPASPTPEASPSFPMPEDSSLDTADLAEPETDDSACITFYPDGSSDSAEIRLAGLAPEDTRRMVVRWDGLSGTANHIVSRDISGSGLDGAGAGTAQPLEPSSVADSKLGPVATP